MAGRRNRHDQWVTFRDSHAGDFNATGIPAEVWGSETRLRLLLTNGAVEGVAGSLLQISDEEFMMLNALVQNFYPDDRDQSFFTAYAKELLTRFGRYA